MTCLLSPGIEGLMADVNYRLSLMGTYAIKSFKFHANMTYNILCRE